MQKTFFNPETMAAFSALTEIQNTEDQARRLAELDFTLSLALAKPAPALAAPDILDAASWAALAVFRAQLEAPDPRLPRLAAMLKPVPQDPEKILNYAASAHPKTAEALLSAILIGTPDAWPEKAVKEASMHLVARQAFSPRGDKYVSPLVSMPEPFTPVGTSQTSRLVSALAALGK